MKKFMGEDFLLSTETAKTLFKACNAMPIYDWHCHLSPKEIYENKEPEDIISERNLSQNSDEEFLLDLVNDVIASEKKSIIDYKNGKKNVLGYIVGKCMKKSMGKANPVKINEIVLNILNREE